jgi:hypothetical protein
MDNKENIILKAFEPLLQELLEIAREEKNEIGSLKAPIQNFKVSNGSKLSRLLHSIDKMIFLLITLQVTETISLVIKFLGPMTGGS